MEEKVGEVTHCMWSNLTSDTHGRNRLINLDAGDRCLQVKNSVDEARSK